MKFYLQQLNKKKLNQDAEKALGNLTSNIGKIIQDIINDVV